MSSTLNLYECNMYLFDHDKPEEFLLFILNFNMTIAATWMLDMDMKIQYLCTIVQGKLLHQFDLLTNDVENTETLNVDYYIKSLALYFPPVNSLSKQKRAMRRRTNISRSLKVRRYTVRLIDLNEYLASLAEATLADKNDLRYYFKKYA